MLKKGRFFAPPRASRMTTMVNTSMTGRIPRKTAHYKLRASLHAMTRILIRPSTVDDLPAVTAIYGWHVRHGTGTFEIDPPTLDDMARRRDDVVAKGLPYLVLEEAATDASCSPSCSRAARPPARARCSP